MLELVFRSVADITVGMLQLQMLSYKASHYLPLWQILLELVVLILVWISWGVLGPFQKPNLFGRDEDLTAIAEVFTL